MKKYFVMLVGLLGLVLLAGCSGGGNDKKDTIVIWTQASADTPEGKMFADRVEMYNELHPDKPKVEIQNITRAGAGSGYIDKLNAAITAGDMPDIFTLDGPDVAAYVDAGVIGEVGPYLSEGFAEGFTASILQQGTVDGKLYALGYSDSAVVIMYNEDMFNVLPDEIKAKVPASDEDWTWDQLLELARDIDQYAAESNDPAFEKYAVAVSTLLTDVASGVYETGTYYFTPLVWSNDSNIVAEDGLTVDGVLNSPQTLEAITKYAQLFAGERPLASAAEPEKAFHSGQAAMAVAGFWYVNEITGNYPDLKFRTLRYPKMNEEFEGLYTPSGSWAFVRSANISEDRIPQVVEVMEWLTNDEASREYFTKNGSIPARINAIDVIDTNTDNPYFNEAWKVMQYQVENKNKARPVSVGYPYLSETFAKDVLLRIAQNKATDEATIQTYLDDAVKKIDQEFAKYKKG